MQCNSTRFTNGCILNFLGFKKNYPACRPAACKKFKQSQRGRSFQELSKTCNFSLLSIPETEEKYALKRPDPLSESYKGKTLKSGNYCKNHISSFLRACFSSFITARNDGHCTNLGIDSAQGFSDAVVGGSIAIERTI